MKTLIISLYSLLIIKYNVYQDDTTAVIGKALNLKEGAIIVTKENKRFYIDGLDYWGKKYIGKIVQVTGVIIIRETKVDTNEPPSQNSSGIKKIITKAKFNLFN